MLLIGLGSDLAQYISPPDLTTTNKPFVTRAHILLQQFLAYLLGYILLSYMYLAATPRNQLMISALFAVLGAYIGNLLAEAISKLLRHPLIPMETLICNTLFGVLGLALNIMKLHDLSWRESLILKGFAINFCGAASLFARHASDNRRLYGKKGRGIRRAAMNMTANILFASVVFWIAIEIEELAKPDEKITLEKAHYTATGKE